jgi:hypothetical protein
MTVCPWRYTCWQQRGFINQLVCPTGNLLLAGHKGDEAQPAQAQISPGNAFGEYRRVVSIHRCYAELLGAAPHIERPCAASTNR